jgi:septum formation protein
MTEPLHAADPTAVDARARTVHLDAAPLVLASASPRRADLLRAAGIAFVTVPADLDESRHAGEQADAYVRRLAWAKAAAIVTAGESRAVLGADTVVLVDDHVLGKPEDARDAQRMLEALSGRAHQVMTGVAIIAPNPPGQDGPADARRSLIRVSTTLVEFAVLSPDDIDWYVASGEPMGKAGAYAIQGLASRFVTRIVGSYSNVVGLPVAEVHVMCRSLGILLS